MKQLVVIERYNHDRLVECERDGEIYLSIEPPPSPFVKPKPYRPPCDVRADINGMWWFFFAIVLIVIVVVAAINGGEL